MGEPRQTVAQEQCLGQYYETNLKDQMFPPELVLIPQIRQIYELDLAMGEYQILTREELVPRAAVAEVGAGAALP